MVATETYSAEASHGDVLEKDDLVIKLDKLLEQYLNTLDDYQRAQQQLASYLSSGYMSLAQANFNNASRTRYGQDYYDERMQAAKKVSVSEDGSDLNFSIGDPRSLDSQRAKIEAERYADSPDSENVSADSQPETSSEQEAQNDSAQGKSPPDPLRWFGILVPPALRSAQSSFVSAIEAPIPRLATLIKDLRHCEIEIGRLRKQIKKL